MSEFLERPGDADRRVRRLQGLQVRLEEAEHRVRLVDLPELALVVEGRVLRPQAEDDLQRLARHVAVGAGHAVDVEHRPVARQAAGGDAEIEPPLRQVVEHGDAVRQLRRVVVGQEEAAGAEADALRLQERLGDQQVGRRVRLPGRGVVLADPGFGVAELVEPAEGLQVEVVPFLQAALRRVRGHGEVAEFHGRRSSSFLCVGRMLGPFGGGAQGFFRPHALRCSLVRRGCRPAPSCWGRSGPAGAASGRRGGGGGR